jgi:hypothetical protein
MAHIRWCTIPSIAGADVESGNRSREGACEPAPPEQVTLDSTHVKTHRFASGGRGGPRSRRSASQGVTPTTRFMRLPKIFYRPCVIILNARQRRRLHGPTMTFACAIHDPLRFESSKAVGPPFSVETNEISPEKSTTEPDFKGRGQLGACGALRGLTRPLKAAPTR